MSSGKRRLFCLRLSELTFKTVFMLKEILFVLRLTMDIMVILSRDNNILLKSSYDN